MKSRRGAGRGQYAAVVMMVVMLAAAAWAADDFKAQIENKGIKTVKLLLDKGADKNAKNKNGETAVFMAVKDNRPEVLKVLVAAKADVNIPDKDGKTALFMAKQKKREELVAILEGK